jgi:hypothetical protein
MTPAAAEVISSLNKQKTAGANFRNKILASTTEGQKTVIEIPKGSLNQDMKFEAINADQKEEQMRISSKGNMLPLQRRPKQLDVDESINRSSHPNCLHPDASMKDLG